MERGRILVKLARQKAAHQQAQVSLRRETHQAARRPLSDHVLPPQSNASNNTPITPRRKYEIRLSFTRFNFL